MLAVQKWAENKPYIIALFAPQIASEAQDLPNAFKQIKERLFFKHQFPLPSLKLWFTLYRSHRKPLTMLKTLFLTFSSISKEGLDLSDEIAQGLRFLHRNKDKGIVPEQFQITQLDNENVIRILQDILSASFTELEQDFSSAPVDPTFKEAGLRFISEYELVTSFFLLVIAPCWLLYKMQPTHLYRKARLGEVDAIGKLLRLDPLMIHDPAIGRRIQKLRFTNKSNDYETLLEAPLKNPKARITLKKIKYSLAGLISAFSTIIKQPLTEPDIRSLFDAVAKDREGDPDAIDNDLPENIGSLTRTIHRERTVWLKIIQPDK